MQFNSNSDFPASQLPTSQWVQVARPPVPFDDATFHPCACITTRVMIPCDSEASLQGVGVEDAQHVMVEGRHYMIKTAKGVLVRTVTPEWSGSSSSDDDDDDDDGDDQVMRTERNHLNGHVSSRLPLAHPLPTSTTTTQYGLPNNNNNSTIERAYWLQRTLRVAIYGCVRYGIVLHKLNPPIPVKLPNTSEWVMIEWKETHECVAIKEMSWEHIRTLRNKLAEDPIKEVAAMQYLGRRISEEEEQKRQLLNATMQLNSQMTGMNLSTLQPSQHLNAPMSINGGGMSAYGIGNSNSIALGNNNSHWPPMSVPQAAPIIQTPHFATESHHIMIPMDILSDDRNLYSVMPYCSGGELFDVLEKKNRFSEPEARYWMRQLLKGLSFLKRWGICHRDLSLENLLVQDGNVLIIDMGMCLRVPYVNATAVENHFATPSNHNQQQQNLQRYLLLPQGVCGKWHYMSPEVCSNQLPFDGPAVDLWAAGVILFLMLTGYPPWNRPELTDTRFKYMTNGYLVQMLIEWQVGLSADAMDLLQRMFWLDPTDRLSLEQVCAHPWMTAQG